MREIGRVVTEALGQLEEGIFQCENHSEWEAIEQQMKDINKEVQSLLQFYIPGKIKFSKVEKGISIKK